MKSKPAVADVHSFLRSNKALLVHFSGAPKGASSGFEESYPDDLHHVIAGGAQSGLACSVVTVGDNFAGGGSRHAFGCVGVIIDLKTPQSLMAVAPQDAGSSVINGVRIYPDRDIDLSDLNDSLSLRGNTHNEWGIRDYTVLGILAVSPFEVWETTPPGFVTTTTIVEVANEFPAQKIVTRAEARWWVTEAEVALYS